MLLFADAGSSDAAASVADAANTTGTGFNVFAAAFVPGWVQAAQAVESKVRLGSNTSSVNPLPKPAGQSDYMGSPRIPATWVRPLVNLLVNAALVLFEKPVSSTRSACFVLNIEP